MRICAISDFHNLQRKLIIPDCDLLIIAGDFSNLGKAGELRALNDWLRGLNMPKEDIVIVPGNHDFLCHQMPPLARQDLDAGTLLIDAPYERKRLKMWGHPWVPYLPGWAFNLEPQAMARKCEMIPDGLDILISHSPPHLELDTPDFDRSRHLGCRHLRGRLMTMDEPPKIVICGHIHTGHGSTIMPAKKPIVVYNVSICDESYKAIYSPTVIEI